VNRPLKINPRKVNNCDVELSHTSRGGFDRTDGAEKLGELAEARREDGMPLGRPFEWGHPKMGGRPKGIAAMIREATGNGRELVELALRIARAQPLKDARGRGSRRPKDRDQIEAIRWLSERGWGRVPLTDATDEQPQLIVLRLKEGQDF
jgi:hypothetical protein